MRKEIRYSIYMPPTLHFGPVRQSSDGIKSFDRSCRPMMCSNDAWPPDSAAVALSDKGLAWEPGTTTMADTVGPCIVTRALNQESSYKRSKRAKVVPLADLSQSKGSRTQCANTLNGRPLATRDQRNSRKPKPMQAWLPATKATVAHSRA